MKRTILLALGMLLLFAATVAVLSNVMPSPHRPIDYLVMGAAATLLCLLLLFVVLINTSIRKPRAWKDEKPDSEA